MLKKNIQIVFIIASALILQQCCGIYNFTGASVNPDIKTISIDNFINETGLGPPRMAQNFTEKLRDYFQSNSPLRVVKSGGDLYMEGAIVGYTISPIAPSQELSSKNRLTIRFKAKFESSKDTTKKFNQEFSFYDDYEQRQSLSTVEDQLIETITNQVVFDVFNKALSDW